MIERLTTLSDKQLDAIMAIWLASNLDAHDFVPAHYWYDNFEAVKQALPQSELTIARSSGKIIGFAGMQGNYLAGLFVDEAWRRQGVGAQLLVQLQASHPVITLDVFDKNLRAKRFYRRQGFYAIKKQFDDALGAWEWRMTNGPT